MHFLIAVLVLYLALKCTATSARNRRASRILAAYISQLEAEGRGLERRLDELEARQSGYEDELEGMRDRVGRR